MALEWGLVQGYAHDLPFDDDSFDFAICWDCIEHLTPGDEVLALAELKRVARKKVAFSIALRPSKAKWKGKQLHINLRPESEWDDIVESLFPDTHIEKPANKHSPIWIVTL